MKLFSYLKQKFIMWKAERFYKRLLKRTQTPIWPKEDFWNQPY
jgi:hypothetical protein